MEFYGLTHTGLARDNNEDSFEIYEHGINILPNLIIVADGMGGHQSGEVASRAAIDYFVEYIEKNSNNNDVPDIMDLLSEALQYANAGVYKESLSNPKLFGMGTTLTACVLCDKKLYVAHIGDTRLYIAYNDRMQLITSDHTYVHELMKLGIITYEESLTDPRRNILTKALGVADKVEMDAYVAEFSSEDVILVCSDGLTGMLSDDEIFYIIKNSDSLQKSAQTLVDFANRNGGIDNITVVLAKVKRCCE